MELKGFLGLVMVPQYICAMLYVLAVAAFVVDVLSKEKRRIHFLTTSFVSYNKGERGIFFLVKVLGSKQFGGCIIHFL